MRLRSSERFYSIKRYIYLFRMYRFVNGVLDRKAEECDGVPEGRLPDGNRKVLVITIAFNNEVVLKHQIQYMRKFWKDGEREYLIADNSPLKERQDVIRELCRKEGIPYLLLPRDARIDRISGSFSHGTAVTWLYHNYIKGRNPYIFGFLDHDIFPVRPFSMEEKMQGMPYYGFREDRGGAWYIWMGLLFMKTGEVSGHHLNFLPCKVGDERVYMDTGGSLWYTLFSIKGDAGCRFPERVRVPMFVKGKRHRDPVDYIDDCWMHTNNGSNWKNIEDKQDLVNEIWQKYEGVIPEEIHFD